MPNSIKNVAALESVRKYERKISIEGLIRRFCDKDHAATTVALHYVRRFKMNDALWIDPDNVTWIAQPLRCSAEELDMAESYLKRVHTKLVRRGVLEVVSRKLYPTAVRKTTHVRPTDMFRFLLDKLGYWPCAGEGISLRPSVAQNFAKACAAREIHIASIEATYIASIGAAKGIQQKGLQSVSSKEEPAASQADQAEDFILSQKEKSTPPAPPQNGEIVSSQETVVMAFNGGSKTGPHTGFKGSTPPTTTKAVEKPVLSVQEAVQKALAPKPTAGSKAKGEKTKLWVQVAKQIHAAGKPWPISADAVSLARLWDFHKKVGEEWPEYPNMFWDMIREVSKDWAAFGQWVFANTTVKKMPGSLDLMWLQAHRLQACEYALHELNGGAEKPSLQSIALEATEKVEEAGTLPSGYSWKVV